MIRARDGFWIGFCFGITVLGFCFAIFRDRKRYSGFFRFFDIFYIFGLFYFEVSPEIPWSCNFLLRREFLGPHFWIKKFNLIGFGWRLPILNPRDRDWKNIDDLNTGNPWNPGESGFELILTLSWTGTVAQLPGRVPDLSLISSDVIWL